MKSLAKVFFLVPLLSLFFFSLTVWAGCQFRCSMLRKRIWYHLFDTQVTWSSAVRLAPADSNTVCVVSLSGRFFSCPHRTTVILRQTGENRRHHISFFNYFQFWSLLEQDELGKHWGGKKKKKKNLLSQPTLVSNNVSLVSFQEMNVEIVSLLARLPSERTQYSDNCRPVGETGPADHVTWRAHIWKAVF